jgi:hypothetical protein
MLAVGNESASKSLASCAAGACRGRPLRTLTDRRLELPIRKKSIGLAGHVHAGRAKSSGNQENVDVRLSNIYRSILAACVCAAFAATVHGAPKPSDTLLPPSTKAYLSVQDPTALRKAWESTQLGRLALDPQMKPFVDSFRDQLKGRLMKTGKKIGIDWTDLENVPGGEMALAMVEDRGTPATVLIVDVTGHRDQSTQLLAKVDRSLTSQGAKKSTQRIAGETVTVYDLPRDKGELQAARAFHVVKDDAIVATDSEFVLEGILNRWSGDAKETLANLNGYRQVMTQLASQASDLKPHARWFIEPFGFVETARAEGKQTTRKRDIFKALKNQGYTAIQALGGYINFAPGRYELLHRTVVYAPTAARVTDGEKYTLAARALDFPNIASHAPPAWVLPQAASYGSLSVKPAKSFEVSKSLINDLANDPKTDKNPGFIDDILDGIARDPSGPQVNIERDILGNLADHAYVMTDYELPITPTSERVLAAVEVKNMPAVLKAFEQLMNADANAKPETMGGVKIWVMTEPPIDETAALTPAVVTIGGDGVVPVGADEEAKDDGPAAGRLNAVNSAWGVGNGYLFRASHVDILRKAIKTMDARKSLAAEPDYLRVSAEMDKLGAGDNSFRFFGRTDAEARSTFELIKAGKMPEAESMFGKMLNRILQDPMALEPRKQKIDGSKLPPFAVAQKYLGPAGTFVTTTNDGWVITGFTLTRGAAVEVGMAPK